MAESNRTERRLLDSIRKAKTGPADEIADDVSTGAEHATPKTARSRAKSRPSDPAAERTNTGLAGSRSAGRRGTTHKAAAPAPPKKRAQAAARTDRYQSDGRVWPD